MRTTMICRIGGILLMALPVVSCNKGQNDGPPVCGGKTTTITTTTVVVGGLNDPRGLKFGPDGLLYVAEAGIGGTDTAKGCAAVIPPVGPYLGSDTGARISRIDWSGN